MSDVVNPTTDWKDKHANDSGKALKHPLVIDVIKELLGNLGVKGGGLEEYGIRKVAMYTAQVARAQALGFDPDILRLSDEEADQELLKVARMAVETGKPVTIIVPPRGEVAP